MTYQIKPVSPAPFAALFALSDAALRDLGARRMIVDTPDSAPCRVSLRDADPGETLILVHYVHLTDPSSPYRSGGPIFVRQVAVEADLPSGVVPRMLSRRLLSARAYDRDGMMVDADVVHGADLHERLLDWLADAAITQVQIHTARRGCYLARAVHAG